MNRLIALCIAIFIVIVAIILIIMMPKDECFFSDDIFNQDEHPLYMIKESLGYDKEHQLHHISKEIISEAENCNYVDYPGDEWKQENDGNGVGRHEYKICPFSIFGVTLKNNIKKCQITSNLISNISGVKFSAFIKVSGKTILSSHSTWASVSNTTLRCALPIVVASSDISKCGIWVEKQCKGLRYNEWIIYDHSKMCSIYNKMDTPCIMLVLDILRPKEVKNGISTLRDPDESEILRITTISESGK